MFCKRCGLWKDRRQFGETKPICKDCRSHDDRERHFKLSKEDYGILLVEQKGVCAICGQPETRLSSSGKPVSLSVDHDHSCCPGRSSCGKCVRGLLCERCNRSIGLMEENIEYLESAIAYLKKYMSEGSEE